MGSGPDHRPRLACSVASWAADYANQMGDRGLHLERLRSAVRVGLEAPKSVNKVWKEVLEQQGCKGNI